MKHGVVTEHDGVCVCVSDSAPVTTPAGLLQVSAALCELCDLMMVWKWRIMYS